MRRKMRYCPIATMINYNNPFLQFFSILPEISFFFILLFALVPTLRIDCRRCGVGISSGIGSVLPVKTDKTQQYDKPQLPENRIFAGKVGAQIIYGKSISPPSRCEERRNFSGRPSSLP